MNRPPAIRPRLSLPPWRPLPGRGNTLRRLSLGLVSTSLLGGLAPPTLWALQPAVVQGDNVNVRGRASLVGEVLLQLNQGDLIQMVDKIVAAGAKDGAPSRWAKIQLPATVPVYVHATFLDGDTVAATKLNIRGGPGENYSVLGSLQRGDKIHSLGKQGDWVRISPTPETYAFIAADYVIEAAAAPPAAPPAAHPVVATVASPPSVLASVPVVATSPTPRVVPPSAPTVPAETKAVPTVETPARVAAPPIVVAQAAPAAPSAAPTFVAPPVTPAAVAIPTPAILAQAPAQPIPSNKPADTIAAKPASTPAAPTIPSETKAVPTVETPARVAAPPIVVAQAAPAAPSAAPTFVAPPVTPAAVAIPPPAILTLAQAQPIPSNKPADKIAAMPASAPAASLASKDRVEQLEPTHEEHYRNRISLGYRFGLNNSVEFRGFAAAPLPPLGSFDDGYVLDSSRQTAGPNPAPDGRTWNWGYDRPTQVQGDSLLMTQSYPLANTASHKLDDHAMSGFELTYSWELWSGSRFEACHFGVEVAFNYSALAAQNTWTHSVDMVRNTTTYELGGVVPPYDPLTGRTYQGTYGGPGPTIPRNGTTRQITIPDGASMTSYRELSANTYGLRLGPYFESPLYKNLWGNLGTGLAIGLVDGELRYADAVQGLPMSGSASDFSALVGWYIGGGLSYNFNHSWSLFYSAQYQWLPDYTLKAGATEATFKAGNGLFQSIGIRYSF